MGRSFKHNIGVWATIILIIAVYPYQAAGTPQDLLEEKMEDGVVLAVHLPDGLEKEGYAYAQEIAQAAATAYKEIVVKQGFNRPGYTFANCSNFFAYDKDRTIDIYIVDTETPFTVLKPEGGLEYAAKIFLPLDYESYRKRYQIDDPCAELKGSLAHELLHIVTFSYNRNMQASSQGKTSVTSHRWDWYTEGLARYFETLVGYKQEFLSFGYREQDGQIVKVYKGGANYFLTYPDEALEQRKYDFSLFWQYIHENFGMEKIEEISARFREVDAEACTNQEAMELIADVLGMPLKNLLRNFSLYVYKISFVCAKEGLNPVAIAKLDGRKRTISSIFSFGYDFYEIDLAKNQGAVEVKSLSGEENLNCLVRIHSPFGFSSMPAEPDTSGKIKIDVHGLPQNSKMIIMLSNPTNKELIYRIWVN